MVDPTEREGMATSESEQGATRTKEQGNIKLTTLGAGELFGIPTVGVLTQFADHLTEGDRDDDASIVRALQERGEEMFRESNDIVGLHSQQTFVFHYKSNKERELLVEALDWWAETTGTGRAKTLARDIGGKLKDVSPPRTSDNRPEQLPGRADERTEQAELTGGEILSLEDALREYAEWCDGMDSRRVTIADELAKYVSSIAITEYDRIEDGDMIHIIEYGPEAEMRVICDAISKAIQTADNERRQSNLEQARDKFSA